MSLIELAPRVEHRGEDELPFVPIGDGQHLQLLQVDLDQGLWVVTTSGAPRKGARVDVTGRLQDGYDLSAFGRILNLPESLQNGLVLIESSHRARN